MTFTERALLKIIARIIIYGTISRGKYYEAEKLLNELKEEELKTGKEPWIKL